MRQQIKRYTDNKTRRAVRIRGKVRQSGLPRLSVFRSNKYLYAQVIDDQKGVTVVGVRGKTAQETGKSIAKAAVAAGVTKVVFDRGAYNYHGHVKVLAETAREGGLKF